MTWLFIIMAIVAFLVAAAHARRRDGIRMAFAFAVLILWVIAALWWSGHLGG